ncbi:hypothetical protein HaLaN_11560 [Haematococcus lacustris]|uniref:Uncharacterized protein n=1 Tax=Haematococcus lacustris TaxID=44745 RepID=A0A699Z0N9_HAELA|nr:hypothetical protein HaLaN_11560 [Haematococcus lacustris]
MTLGRGADRPKRLGASMLAWRALLGRRGDLRALPRADPRPAQPTDLCLQPDQGLGAGWQGLESAWGSEPGRLAGWQVSPGPSMSARGGKSTALGLRCCGVA